jgi:hypothetical protein
MNKMDRFIATCEEIITKYEENKLSIPHRNVKDALKAFKNKYKSSSISEFYEEHRDKLLANPHEFFMSTKSAIIHSKKAFIATSNIYRYANELAEDTKKLHAINEIESDTYSKYPLLKLPIVFLIDLWKLLLTIHSTEHNDYSLIKEKIAELEGGLSKKTFKEDDELKSIITKLADVVKEPEVSNEIAKTIKEVNPDDIGSSLPRIYNLLNNERIKKLLG